MPTKGDRVVELADGGRVDVVGEARYQDNLEAAAGGRTHTAADLDVPAFLRREPRAPQLKTRLSPWRLWIEAVEAHQQAKAADAQATSEQDAAHRRELSEFLDDSEEDGRDERPAANVNAVDARDALVAAQKAWVVADREFVADLRRFSRAASRSGDDAIEATESATRTREKATRGGLQEAFDACEAAGAPVDIPPSVAEEFPE